MILNNRTCKQGRGFFVLALVSILIALFSGCANDRQSSNDENPISKQARDMQEVLYKEASISEELGDYSIAYFEPSEQRQESVPLSESDEPFTITDYGPVDELPAELKFPSIYVTFSQPVIPLSRLGSIEDSSNVFRVNPPVGGVFRWYGTRMVSLDVTEELLPQREYTVTVNRELTSLGGKKLTGDTSFTFRTEYLSVRDFFTGVTERVTDLEDVPIEEAKKIHIVFSYPVDVKTIEPYIDVFCRNKPYSFTLHRPLSGAENGEAGSSPQLAEELVERTAVLHVDESFPPDSDVQVIINPGARSFPEALPIPKPIIKSFHTLKPFHYEEYSSYSWSIPRSERGDANPVYLKFSHPVADEKLHEKITVVPFREVTAEKVSVWGETVKLNNLFYPDTTYTIALDPAIRDVYGRKLGKAVSTKVTMPPAEQYAFFPNTGARMLEAQFPPKIVWETQNVFDGVWKVASVEDPYGSFEQEELYPFDFTALEKNVRHFEELDLSPWLDNAGKGFVGIAWNFSEPDAEGKRKSWGKRELRLQVTDLAVTTRYGYNKVIAMVTSLDTGDPVREARVDLLDKMEQKRSAVTNEEGLAVFTFEPGEYSRLFGDEEYAWSDHLRIEVEKADDRIIFKPNNSHNAWRFGIYNDLPPTRVGEPHMVCQLFTDRGIYKPGETLSFRGIDRTLQRGRYKAYTGPYEIILQEPGYDGRVIETITGTATENGGFAGSVQLPNEVEPGHYTIMYSRDGKSAYYSFQVAEFRRLGFSVSIEKPDLTYYQGDKVGFTVSSDYLAGGAVSKGTYESVWFKEPYRFFPGQESKEKERLKQYRFCPDEYDGRRHVATSDGVLNASGEFTTNFQTTSGGITGMPYVYEMEARVTDISNQQIAARKGVLVHPASFYIGAKLKDAGESYWSPFVEKGKPTDVEFITVGPDGTAAGNMVDGSTVTVSLFRVTWKLARQQGVYERFNTRWERVEELISEEEINLSDSNGSVSVTPPQSGSYYVRLEGIDKSGRKAVTEFSFYATGAGYVRWGGGNESEITLKPDRDTYEPGDTARILVQTPLPEGRYLVTIEREGILDERVVTLEGSARLLEVPIKEEYLPVVYISLASYSVRSGEPTHTYFEPDLDKPKGYFGITPVQVSPEGRRIDLELTRDKKTYLPGEEATLTVTAKRGGKPFAGAEVALVAADRGVLDLISYRIQDPVGFFYNSSRFPLGVRGADSRSLLIDPVTYEVKDLRGGDAGDGKMEEQQEAASLKERKDFNPTALFEPFLVTDEEGKATVTFTLPDTLTRYRVTAVAVKEDRFGIIEDEIPVSNPINIKTAFPLKLRLRDTAIGSVIVTNVSDESHEVEIGIETELLEVTGKNSHNFVVPQGATLEVPFKVAATREGTATVSITTRSEVVNEKLTEEIVVEKPYVYESFTTIGETKERAEEGLVIPSGAEDGIGGLFVTLDGSRISLAKEAIEYLLFYPFDCMEQRVSRMLPYILLGDYLIDSGLVEDYESIESRVAEELLFWSTIQQQDGGFPLWPEHPVYSSFYTTIRVAHLLHQAKEKGFSVPEEINQQALLEYLVPEKNKRQYSDFLTLYSLYVRSLYGEDVYYQANRYFHRGDAIGLTGYGLLGLTFLELGDTAMGGNCFKRIKQFIRPGTRTIDITDTYETATSFYNSQIEQLALLLMLAAQVDGEEDVTRKALNTLLAGQKSSGWRNTVENQWILQAVDALSRSDAETAPQFDASIVLGGNELDATSFSGTDAPPATFQYDFRSKQFDNVARDTVLPLAFEKNGEGTLYYTATLRYALPSEITAARDLGLSILCTYEDVEGNPVENNRLTAGETYRAKITVTSHRRRNFIALRAPVPSGCDIVNSSFDTGPRFDEFKPEVTGDVYRIPPIQKIMVNEVRYFWNDFSPGKQEVSFIFRATSPGVYPTPPVTAECMYEPEIAGRTEGKLFFIRWNNP
jgi:alpha-2-macroglobulin